ncbi:MAG: ABC transporter permease subunit, partial [Nitrospinaceae bacterium]|nr:ABC transporter permease subunit [Nitrospinaceae bacterium]
SVQAAITARFANREAERVEVPLVSRDGSCHATLTLSRFRERSRPPQSVRMTFREMISEHNAAARIVFTPSLTVRGQPPELWHSLQPKERDFLQAYVAENFDRPALRQTKTFSGISYQVELEKNDVSYPHPPVKGHWFGFDDAGRDVFARVFYGFRVSVTFGLVLVTVSMLLGTVMGAVQGYRGGKTDIFMQRLIEIWSTLPFLYVMILMGAVFGRGLLILMVCYGLFNWIGISYYMRAEFLRLRGQPFVEAARCMGIPAHKIMYRHILPNAVTPVITFFPFSLVSAVYALVALDYLGFGL